MPSVSGAKVVAMAQERTARDAIRRMGIRALPCPRLPCV